MILGRTLLSEMDSAGLPAGADNLLAPRQEERLFCRGRNPFQIVNTSSDVDEKDRVAAVVGEIRNTCNKALFATVSAAYVSVQGRVVAVVDSEVLVGPLGPGESTFFRVKFTGEIGYKAAQRRDVVRKVNANVTQTP